MSQQLIQIDKELGDVTHAPVFSRALAKHRSGSGLWQWQQLANFHSGQAGEIVRWEATLKAVRVLVHHQHLTHMSIL